MRRSEVSRVCGWGKGLLFAGGIRKGLAAQGSVLWLERGIAGGFGRGAGCGGHRWGDKRGCSYGSGFPATSEDLLLWLGWRPWISGVAGGIMGLKMGQKGDGVCVGGEGLAHEEQSNSFGAGAFDF